MTTQRFFTEKGVKQVKAKYDKLIGSDFYFDDTNTKYRLDDIIPQEASDGYNIKFESYKPEPYKSKVIYEFMQLNKEIDYDFNDFESIIVRI